MLDYAFSILYSTAACYCAPARRSVFSDAGSLCLFAYMWHRCLLPVLDALVLRVHKETKADALLVLPLYVLFQILISAPFPQLGEVFGRLRRGRVRFRDMANPFQLFAGLFLLGALSYAWG
jgi:cytochrome c biogenesis protein CcdA